MNVGTCPGCRGSDTKDLGEIPHNDLFAGRQVEPMPARLAVCRHCHLGFRSPQPSREKLAELYAAGSESAWQIEDQPRPDWRRAAELVSEIAASTVLDVGCFDGSFFDLVDPDVTRLGIEINPEASQRARQRGVTILARDLHELRSIGTTVDCAVAFDVIEHVHDPADFLSELLHVVGPGGHVIIATGDFTSPEQRMMRSKYLYSWYQEHIAFVSPRWIRAHAAGLGVEIVELERFSHHPHGARGFLSGLAKNAAYRLAPDLVNRGRRSPLADGETLPSVAPPAWVSAKDHFLVLLRKSG